MRKQESQPDQSRHAGYELRDVSLIAIIRWMIFLFVFVGLASGVTWIIYKLFAPDQPGEARLASLPFSEQRPPEPRIQADPKIDIEQFREAEDKALTSYGWVDKNAGVAKIPIDRAMTLLEQRGLPTPPDNAAFQAKPASAPVERAEGSALKSSPQETPPITSEGAGATGSHPQGNRQGAPTASPTTAPIPPPGR